MFFNNFCGVAAFARKLPTTNVKLTSDLAGKLGNFRERSSFKKQTRNQNLDFWKGHNILLMKIRISLVIQGRFFSKLSFE